MKTLYTVVVALDDDELSMLVRDKLRDGWSLQGGAWVETWVDRDGNEQSTVETRYAQALVREVPE